MIELCRLSKSVVGDRTFLFCGVHYDSSDAPLGNKRASKLGQLGIVCPCAYVWTACSPATHPNSISHTKLPRKARMATERAVENNQIFLNPCVLVDRLHQSFPLCGDVAQELSINSAQIAESHARLSEQRIEVTGSCSNPNSLMPG